MNEPWHPPTDIVNPARDSLLLMLQILFDLTRETYDNPEEEERQEAQEHMEEATQLPKAIKDAQAVVLKAFVQLMRFTAQHYWPQHHRN